MDNPLKQLGRAFTGAVVGLLVGFAFTAAIDIAGVIAFPPPEGFEPTNIDAVLELNAARPLQTYLPLIIGWFSGTYIGAWLAGRVAQVFWPFPGWIVVIFLFTAGLATMFSFPHPLWVWGLGILAFAAGGWMGTEAGK
jgi:hypothetical protein